MRNERVMLKFYTPLYILLFKHKTFPIKHISVDDYDVDIVRLQSSVRALQILKEKKVFFGLEIVRTKWQDDSTSLFCVLNNLYTFAKPLKLKVAMLNDIVEYLVELIDDTEFGYNRTKDWVTKTISLTDYLMEKGNPEFKETFDAALLKKEMRRAWRFKLTKQDRLQKLCNVNFIHH
jgi:hypothetical protein